eukprot:Tbor_TRINITY_DN4142_c0_g1::TRINITY_DN4142_c0_g1_i1::g.26495::m.26495/K15100/SLC25A1, CTP; solute carrier family 25 (mitochondrial citrate transporter), member 1
MILVQLLISFVVFTLFFGFALALDRNICISIIAGAFTGLSEGIIMFPLENLKIQQQLDGSGFVPAIRRTYTKYGLLGFFRGLTPVLIGAIPAQATRWGCYEAYCSVADCHSNLWHITIAGILSGIINCCVTGVPIETLKTSMIHSQLSDNSKIGHKDEVYIVEVPSSEHAPLTYYDPDAKDDSLTADDIRLTTVTSRYTSALESSSNRSCSNILPSGGSCQDLLTIEHEGIDNKKKSLIPTPAKAHSRVFTMPQTQDTYVHTVSNFRTTSSSKSWGYPRFNQNYNTVFRGFGPTLLKKIINQGARFPIHAWSLRVLCFTFSPVDMGSLCKYNHAVLNFTAGTFAGFSTIFITHPIDVAKTRMQALDGHRFRNTIHCLKTIIMEDGYSSLTHGLFSRTLRVSIGVGISFMFFPIFQMKLREFFSMSP